VAAASLVAFCIAIATMTVGYRGINANDNLDLSVGDVAPYDILAPRDSSFESPILTEQRRQEVASSVRSLYKTDDEVTRRQVTRARLVMDYIEHVRHDPFATQSQKESDLTAIENLGLDSQIIAALLFFNDAEWRQVSDQVVSVLSSVMSGEVREDSLETIYEAVPRHSILLPVEQESVVTELVVQLICPNTFIDPDATETAREAARTTVLPVVRSFREGEIVVSGGQVINEADMEAMVQFGLLRSAQDRGPELIAALIAVLLGAAMIGLYVNRFHVRYFEDVRASVLLSLVFLLFLIVARMMIVPNSEIIPYLYPSAAMAFVITAVVEPQLAILATMVLGLLVGIITGTVEMASLVVVGGIVGVLSLRRTERINAFFKAGTLVGAANAGVILVFRLTGLDSDVLTLLVRAGAGLVNGILAAAVALAGLFLLGSVFNVTTGLVLTDLARPDHPLLQRLMREAPGTYQHSLLIANMAETAAEAIDANVLLTRVGAMYHDIGKMYKPGMFVENQAYGDNVHDRLAPVQSAQYIIRHVSEGSKLARQYRLPVSVRNFITEHHGTTIVRYFWHKAVEQAGGDESAVDPADFIYPGPKPQSRETAILMLADSSESAVRAAKPANQEEIAEVVDGVISQKVGAGQLDKCDLTLRDLNLLRDAFVHSLKGVFHPRIAYPKEGEPEGTAVSEVVTLPEPEPAQVRVTNGELTGIELAAAEMASLKPEEPSDDGAGPPTVVEPPAEAEEATGSAPPDVDAP
jgi:putative nucleotidyltransferase with HDIG domain